jgi:hypothetical protein
VPVQDFIYSKKLNHSNHLKKRYDLVKIQRTRLYICGEGLIV